MRADVFLSVNGYAKSRQRAQTLIAEGLVTVDGKRVVKPSEDIPEGDHTVSVSDPLPFVGRGGCKLDAALDAFGIDPKGALALDIGASTGGFTDCLLQRGAARVIAVDAGKDQLAKALREDPRVVSMEQVNARYLTLSDIGGKAVDLIVMDVSFISATYILPRFSELLGENGQAVCLVKPQFEVGRAYLGKGGVVRDPKAHLMAIERVKASANAACLDVRAVIQSPIVGGDGNIEFLAHLVRKG